MRMDSSRRGAAAAKCTTCGGRLGDTKAEQRAHILGARHQAAVTYGREPWRKGNVPGRQGR